MTDISKAIKAINPTAEFSVNAEDYEQITWLNGTTPIAVDDIKTKLESQYGAVNINVQDGTYTPIEKPVIEEGVANPL